ncbi:MAG TPA: dicarboxylate/amino acid:cation symporter [Bacteroidales bacterium]|nr:dicarboxylate/amino acid:cation symporter [Bacteroidales bacterium]
MKKRFSLPLQIATAIVLAVILGSVFPSLSPYISWIGTLFLKALKMIVAPLVLVSIICGMTKLQGGKDFGRLGVKTLAWYIATSLIAIITGLILVNLIKPGVGTTLNLKAHIAGLSVQTASIWDSLMRIVPDNMFRALVETEMLAIIFIAMLFGYFITVLEDQHKKTLTSFFEAANELVMKVTGLIISFSPLGIFGIVIKIVAEQPNLGELIYRLGLYMFVVIAGLIIHSVIILPLILKLSSGISPLRHAKAMVTPLLTAFSTSSSNAALPLSMDAMEKNAGVSVKLTSFTLPLGTTINMNGTALYEIVAALFIAQAYGINLTVGQQVITVFTALMAAVGAAGVPMAGMVTMGMVLTAVGLPMEGIGLILAVDRILDMFRTAVNVWGDTTVCAIIAKSEGEKIYT